MKVHLNVRDYLDRALRVYPDRTAVIDEPDQPAAPLGGGSLDRKSTRLNSSH